jgi:hypothetical protein
VEIVVWAINGREQINKKKAAREETRNCRKRLKRPTVNIDTIPFVVRG